MPKKKFEGLEISTIILTQMQDKKSQGMWAASSKSFNHSHCPINFDVIHPVMENWKLRPLVWSPRQ